MTGRTIYVLSVYRPEAADDPDSRDPGHPFDGIEIYDVFQTEGGAFAKANRLRKEHPGWHFHIEPRTLEWWA